MAERFWIPATERDGIPYGVVEYTVNMLMRWRDEHLGTVGATNDLQNHADYVAAVGACECTFSLSRFGLDMLIVESLGASDCSYNVLWIILSQAMEDFGIKEVNEMTRSSAPARVLPNGEGSGTPLGIPAHLAPMVELERAVANEAFKSATRIAGLVCLVALQSNSIHPDTDTEFIRFGFEGGSSDIEWIHAP
jgi:hypothetical protein